jgi:hypothetical protein
MTKYRLSAFAMLATLSFAVPAHAQTLGASCRKGNLASCRTLCARGFHKACAKAKGRGGPPGKAMVEMGERSLAEMQANGLIATGLVPVFPKEARCTPIASPFGSHTRYDGSIRTPKGNFGYHGGIDISLPIGTPILAISDGTVVGKRHGGRLVGNELMVRQSLADTGLPVWTFTKYKHFSRLPRVKIGERVHRGQIIGLSGNTGTVGGHYGSRGYAHLHMSTYSNADGRYTTLHGRTMISHGRHVDPLAFYFRRTLNSQAIRALPADQRRVVIPYVTTDGRTVPDDARAVWPVKCRPTKADVTARH